MNGVIRNISHSPKSVAVIVAHPDDETLWASGLMLSQPRWHWYVASLTRRSDPDRAPRFARALTCLGACGEMADLDDGPGQQPLDRELLQQTVLSLLPPIRFSLVLTHGPQGEYTRHRRHEETSAAVAELWRRGAIDAGSLWFFAYDDGGGRHLPRAHPSADLRHALPETLRRKKLGIITKVYGFAPDSWEARAAPPEEGYWCFDSPRALEVWLNGKARKR